MSVAAISVSGFGYLAPRQVLSGPGSSRTCGNALREWGVSPGCVVVIADKVVVDQGLADPVLSGLREAGYVVELFAEIAGEPNDRMTDAAAARARAVDAVAVVGVGGGSAMDVAKVVALLITNKGGVADWLGVVEELAPVAPLALIPTTTGTGAEATRIAMITVGGAKRIVSCAQFVPLIAILDGELVAQLPAAVVASTGMDALAHAVESLLSTNRSPLTVGAATQATVTLMSQLEPAYAGDPVARARVLYAAHLAGVALNAGVVLGHSLAYVIARQVPLPHGTCCSLALPYCLAYSDPLDDGVRAHLSAAVLGNPDQSLTAVSEAIRALSGRLGLPQSLQAVGIDAGRVSLMAEQTVAEYPRPNNPVPLETGRVRALLSALHSGDLDAAWSIRTGSDVL